MKNETKDQKVVSGPSRVMKSGEIELAGGKIVSVVKWRPPPGCYVHRMSLNGCVWNHHLVDREYRCKIVGDKLWPLKEGEEVDPKIVHIVRRTECLGLELVSTMEHWWLDKEIERPALRHEDWDFSSLKDSRYDWQLSWAWQYECWREWQPWSDFDRWRKEWRKEVKQLRDPNNEWICGKYTREEAEHNAELSYGGRLPLWLLRDFADYFPGTPWVRIPHEKRITLKDVPPPGSSVVQLDGSLLSLKEPNPDAPKMPPIPEKLRMQHTGWHSLRQPDPKNAEEMALYAEYQHKQSEALQHHMEWCDTSKPGKYCDQVVDEISKGQFSGTYIIHIPWHHTDNDLKMGFAAWLKKKEKELPGSREKFIQTGANKRYADLKQLGALRLLRVMSAEKATDYTYKHNGKALYNNKPDWYDARKKANMNLAKHFGVVRM